MKKILSFVLQALLAYVGLMAFTAFVELNMGVFDLAPETVALIDWIIADFLLTGLFIYFAIRHMMIKNALVTNFKFALAEYWDEYGEFPEIFRGEAEVVVQRFERWFPAYNVDYRVIVEEIISGDQHI